MSIERARAYLKEYGVEDKIQEFTVSSAMKWKQKPVMPSEAYVLLVSMRV